MTNFPTPKFEFRKPDSGHFRKNTGMKLEHPMFGITYEIIGAMVGSISNAGTEAYTTMRANYIIKYFSVLWQLYSMSTVLMTKKEYTEFTERFEEIEDALSIESKTCKTNPAIVLKALRYLQLDVYAFLQEKGLFFPTVYNRGGINRFEREMLI